MDKETRDACQGKYGADLHECLVKLDELEAKVDQVDESERPDYYKKIEELRKKREEIWNRYEAMKKSKDGEWESHKGGIENSLLTLQDALDKSYARWHKYPTS